MQTDIQTDKAALFEILKKHAFFKEKIILSSGKESDYYIDARRVTLMSEGVYLIGKIMLDMVKDDKWDAIGGPTLGADPMIGAINAISHLDGQEIKAFIIRKKPKAHGKQKQIEGPLLPDGAGVVIIDDVATTGKAFLLSLDVLRGCGFKVAKALCIVDRQEGAKEALAEKKCELVSIFTAEDFLKD